MPVLKANSVPCVLAPTPAPSVGARAGTRLYEALIAKYEALGSFTGGPSKADLEHICEEEYQHFTMLQAAIEQLGGEPTAVTPAANLIAELSDNACWGTLVELVQQVVFTDLAQQFSQAQATEQEHIRKV